jgi:CheY-like chemotaxis protein
MAEMRSGRSAEIWIAEDNEDVRLILTRAFKRAHAAERPIFFEDGAKLHEYCKAHPADPKLLLLDLQMPVMGGLDALQAIRQDGRCRKTPVVIFSSHENPETIREAFSHGAKLYLKKPNRIEEYAEIAKLCATGVEAIRDLPPGAVPFSALDIGRVMKLLAPQ